MMNAFFRLRNFVRGGWNNSLVGRTISSIVSRAQQPRIVIVAASRLSELEFYKKSLLGIKLVRWRTTNSLIVPNVTYSNTKGLPSLYNAAIDKFNDDDVLVFMHDDVWISDVNFIEKLLISLKKFDIVGIAGNTRRSKGQPAWAFSRLENDGTFVWDEGMLSGAIRHGDADNSPLSVYGPTPARCELLDGVFLAARRITLRRNRVRFDERFSFHFYDMDFCRAARRAGLLLGTWPLDMTHSSGGAFGGAAWVEGYEAYKKKWRN